MLLAFGLMFTSCNKDKDVAVTPEGEYTLAIEQTDFGFKAAVPMCSDSSMDYVMFKIDDGDWQMSPVLNANGKILTKVLKMAPGTYHLTDFVVYHDVLPVGPGEEDMIVRAAPEIGSEYWDLMANPLNIEIIVEEFIKKEYIVDVLCFEDLFYDKFGFTWFELNKVRIERQCFFGDVCTGKLYQFEGSIYEDQSQGLQMDMPLIMKIEVYKNDETTPIRTFDNMANLGEGDCMEVYWANDEDLEEQFQFVLYGWLPVGSNFGWVKYHTWTFFDDNCPDTGEDGVVDFTIGECNIEGSDYTFAPYVNLPSTTFHIKIIGVSSGTTASPLGAYLDLEVTDIPAGDYDFVNGDYPSFCGQGDVVIEPNVTYTVNITSSLYPLPAELTAQSGNYTEANLAKLNWVINHIQDYVSYPVDFANMQIMGTAHPDFWYGLQLGIWHILGYTAGATQAWEAAVSGTNHNDYVPLPGEYALNIIYATGTKEINPMQMQIVLLDP